MEIESALSNALKFGIENFEIFYNFDAKPNKTNLNKTVELFKNYREKVQNAKIVSVHLPPYSVDDNQFINHIRDKIINMHEIGLLPRIFVVHSQKKIKRWEYTILNLNKMRNLIQENMGFEPDIVIENISSKAFSSVESIETIPQNIEYKFCIDITHFNRETKETIDFLNILHKKNWLGHIHASDISRTDIGIVDPFRKGPQMYHLPPGKGILNWEEIINNLNAIKYNGAFIVECMNFDQALEGYRYITSINRKIAENNKLN